MARIAIALLAVCCLVAFVAAQPLNDEDLLVRARRSPAGTYRAGGVKRRFRPTTLYASRSRDAPTFVAPEEAEEVPSVNSGEDVAQDEPIEEEPMAPVARPGSRARPQRPASAEQEDAGAPPAYGNGKQSGTNAIATSYSRGDGASSNSHAVAYGGNFSGGQFKHRFNKN